MQSIYRKFSSFEALVNDFMIRDGIAIRCGDMEGNTSEVSYKDFAEMIISESFHVKAVLAGCDVIIADPRVPEGFNEYATQVAEAARNLRESQRDEFGRIKGKGGEGELLFFTSGTTSSSKIVRLTGAARACSHAVRAI